MVKNYKNVICIVCKRIMKVKKTWSYTENNAFRHVPEGKMRILWQCPACEFRRFTHRQIGSWKFPTEEFRKREAERLRECRRRIKAEIIEKAGT